MNKLYIQTNSKYKSILMGYGDSSIFDVGCYLVSLTNILNKFGWNFSPESLNELFKEEKLWIGEYKNYIDVNRLSEVLPHIFTSFKKIEPWNDMNSLKWYLSRDYGVIGKVDAKGIGGSGTHFVMVDDIDGNNAVIHDPYTGEHQAVAIRYGNLKNILGLRVFGIKRRPNNGDVINENGGNNMSADVKKLLEHFDVKTIEELQIMVDQELKFLKSEREKNANLSFQLIELNKKHNQSNIEFNKKENNYLEQINRLSENWGNIKKQLETIVLVGKRDFGLNDKSFETEEAVFEAFTSLSRGGNITNLPTNDIFNEIWRRIISSLDRSRQNDRTRII